MKYYALLIVSLFWLQVVNAQVDTSMQVNTARYNSKQQEEKPYVIMISMDGFRYDYLNKYHASHLKELSDNGARAEAMIPSYPSLTFPNHYTLVTGLYPSHHGLVGNSYYDRNFKATYSMKGKTAVEGKWYGGEPLWVLAEKQQMLTASFYWVGSEADIQHTLPTYYYKYNEKISIHNRIACVVNWLEQPADRRPHLITFYFPEVDHQSHHFGPDSKETADAVHFVDSAIYQLTEAVKKTGLKVNYVVVSDHGMTAIDREHKLPEPSLTRDTTKFINLDEGVIMQLYAKDPAYIKPAYEKLKAEAKDYDVYLKQDVPAHLHYGAKDDRYNRIGDIVLIPKWPKVFYWGKGELNMGAHGYDPITVKEMRAVFMAWGPDIKKGITVHPFPNVDVYPVVQKILQLQNPPQIDGTDELAKQILIKK
ncbi:alkaline phosphatase family protein [Mucilaginibacter sp. KACC 22063]|uniref:alkaline phosphatase family protein n=1 Tax=Mucilaginibacter sp. KACC 22063 TaxID=3025666 RepID=UPI0023663389|nr:ectonucleotide pyrophosphatase/phosphodiesterase [Mucilaginibacter sp. KACC 22063]WDF57041.1 ectonucleotide pyrophosphatase/phosphodiesterase [Mucilaginibacter sp. KACC 22063]